MKKFYKNLKMGRRHSLVPSVVCKNKNLVVALEKCKKSVIKFSTESPIQFDVD